MTKKRTTAEEKRALLLSLFKETEDVYNLKEIEKAAYREKGLAMNTVKDTLQQLLDDGQVEEAKVGAQVLYWVFNSKATNDKRIELENLDKSIENSRKQLEELDDKLSKIDPNDYPDDNLNLVKTIDDHKAKFKELEKQFGSASKEGEVKQLIEELNEWTDNLFLIKKYVKNKMNMDDKALDKEFNIPKDLDYY